MNWKEVRLLSEALGKVLSVEEYDEVLSKLGMIVVVISTYGGFLDGAVHAFDLAIGPRVVELGQAAINVVAAQVASKA